MKKISIVVAVVIIAIFVIGMLKDYIIKSVITVVSSQVTGAPVHIEGFSLGVFTVRISGFKMYNPSGFPEGILVDLPRINVSYDLGALFKGRLHLSYVEIDLKEMGIEKNKEGKLNVDSLKVEKQGREQEGKPPKQMSMQIDMLKLGIGKIVYKDYSAGREPVIKVYDINIHQNYKHITSAQQLTALILTEPMKAAGIQGAKIYGVAMLAGVAVLPVAVAAQFVAQDYAQQDFNFVFDKVYETSLGVVKKMGRVTKADKAGGLIRAEVDSATITVKFKRLADKKTQVNVSARKYLLPKPEIAKGVLYKINERLK